MEREESSPVAPPVAALEVPALSVIVPARNAAATIGRVCAALTGGSFARRRMELVVVDDASDDDTAVLAAMHADTVVRLPGPDAWGPSYARNRGAELARGAVLVFVDADLVVHPDALSRVERTLAADEGIAALVGSFDGAPPATGLASRYHNLLRHHLHQLCAGDIDSFWAGCGAVRRDAFRAAGGFDEWRFRRPSIEDQELGRRLLANGSRVVLDPALLGTHLKRWTVLGTLLTTTRDLSVPLARSVGVRGMMVGARARRSPFMLDASHLWLTAALLACVVAWAATGRHAWGAATLVATLLLLARDRRLLGRFLRAEGVLLTLAMLPLHLLTVVAGALAAPYGWFLRHLIGEERPPALVQAFSEVGVTTWPPLPTKR